jgi:hypothetical protein
MFISIVILLVLVLAFSVLSLWPVSRHLRIAAAQHSSSSSCSPFHHTYPHTSAPAPRARTKKKRKRRFNLRRSLIATLPDLLDTTILFTDSVIVSSYVCRWTTHSRFDALMVDALSMLCATSVVMLCASYWATTTTPDSASISYTQEWVHPGLDRRAGIAWVFFLVLAY